YQLMEVMKPLRRLEKLQQLEVWELVFPAEDLLSLAEECFPPSLDWNKITLKSNVHFMRVLFYTPDLSDESFARALAHTSALRVGDCYPSVTPLMLSAVKRVSLVRI